MSPKPLDVLDELLAEERRPTPAAILEGRTSQERQVLKCFSEAPRITNQQIADRTKVSIAEVGRIIADFMRTHRIAARDEAASRLRLAFKTPALLAAMPIRKALLGPRKAPTPLPGPREDREKAVMRLLIEGAQNKAIAETLNLPQQNVVQIVSTLYAMFKISKHGLTTGQRRNLLTEACRARLTGDAGS